MKRNSIIIAVALATAVGAATLGFNTPSFAQPYGGGWGFMGPGMMGGYEPGWMHGGYGSGWCWGNYSGDDDGPAAHPGQATPQQQDLQLTADDVGQPAAEAR